MSNEITKNNTLVEEFGSSLEHDSHHGLKELYDTDGGVRQQI